MKSVFRDVKEDIRGRILNGDWKPGELIPNEVNLAAEFGCARATVNRAVRELAEDGLVERKRKSGTRVRISPLRQARFNIPIVRKEIEALGANYRYTLIDRAVATAPEWLRERLKLTGAAKVIHLTCLHFKDGAPYQYEDRWINLDALPQAIETSFETLGPNEWLIETVPFSDAEISFSATPATEVLANHLHCTAGDALFLVERSTWWDQKAITFVKLYYQAGHRMTTQY
jgi:GntR family histidine utilization transcriptional repressor